MISHSSSYPSYHVLVVVEVFVQHSSMAFQIHFLSLKLRLDLKYPAKTSVSSSLERISAVPVSGKSNNQSVFS